MAATFVVAGIVNRQVKTRMSGFTNKLVAVTGASGFVGRNLVKRLRLDGAKVLELSRASGFDILSDQANLEGVTHVFHIAGLTGIPHAWKEPVAFFETNALGTMRILEQCRLANCPMTFLSAYIYGAPQFLPITEQHPVVANNPYGFSKRVAEDACTFYVQNYGLRCVSLRLFNTYGPGQSSDFLLPFIVEQVLDDSREAIEVQDLEPRRDYVFVDDVVDAIVSAQSAAPGSVFNIGSGVTYSVEEVIQLTLRAAGRQKPYRAMGEKRKNEVNCVQADISALQQATGWRPRTSLADGIRKLIENAGRP
ncbi:GDP-mannose 4,6-dehydratase [Aminobacter sp. AP02]|uniref:NAD-dependent epimerase/dehydratase family protein n=1 Tax=Aminobacter sp. AP02 TaxID=2135737 RepID=UPI000D6B43DA|nr:GDP-mannose 4,6-dehydratase [Aminobacter sp. AP02]